MQLIYGILLTALILGIVFGLGYLLITGLVWLALVAAETGFGYNYEGNVWAAGLVVCIAVVVIGFAFNRKN